MSRELPVSIAVMAPMSALFLFASTLISGDRLYAQSRPASAESAVADAAPLVKPPLDIADEIAALDAAHIALTEAGDGATYVWQRHHGRLNGSVRITNTFRAGDGRMCRHIVMSLTAGRYTRRTEGVACRDADRVWSLEG